MLVSMPRARSLARRSPPRGPARRVAATVLALAGQLACTAVDRPGSPAEPLPPPVAAGPMVQVPKDMSPATGPAEHAPTDLPLGAIKPSPDRLTVAADDGHPIAVHVRRPAAPWAAVVLVHGRTWSALPDFDLQVPGGGASLMDALVAAGVSAYAVDLRGYGATPRDPTGFATPAQATADVAAVLRAVAREAGLKARPALLGWSLGARVVALTAQRHPDLAGALVLYGSPCSDPRRRPSTPIRSVSTPARRATTEAAARADFITPGAIDPAVADAFVRAALAADPIKADWRDVEVWSTIDFRRLSAPILVIHGERDPGVDAACLRARLAEAAPATAMVVLPGADHVAHLEQAGPRFVAEVVAFLDRHVREDRNK